MVRTASRGRNRHDAALDRRIAALALPALGSLAIATTALTMTA
jgi:hypothetical protein